MECVIGIVGKDFVLLASDTLQVHSIVVMTHGKDFCLFKIKTLTMKTKEVTFFIGFVFI
jgi:hypothetical protein